MQERSGTRTTPPNLSEPSALTVFRICNVVFRSRNECKASPFNRCKRDGLLRLPVTAIPSLTQALSIMLPSQIYFHFPPPPPPPIGTTTKGKSGIFRRTSAGRRRAASCRSSPRISLRRYSALAILTRKHTAHVSIAFRFGDSSVHSGSMLEIANLLRSGTYRS